MTNPETAANESGAIDLLRSILKSQYHAALAMLGQAIERFPEERWLGDGETNAPWQIAYHTLFFAHCYMMPSEHAFVPWEHHQPDNQYPDAIAGPPDPESDLPLLPEPYTREQALAYWNVCDAMVDATVDSLDLLSTDSGFHWYPVPKLEHQIVNLRHIQHGAAQLADRLRAIADVGVDWAGARRAR